MYNLINARAVDGAQGGDGNSNGTESACIATIERLTRRVNAIFAYNVFAFFITSITVRSLAVFAFLHFSCVPLLLRRGDRQSDTSIDYVQWGRSIGAHISLGTDAAKEFVKTKIGRRRRRALPLKIETIRTFCCVRSAIIILTTR